MASVEEVGPLPHCKIYCHLKCLAHTLEAAFCLCVLSSKHQGHCGLLGQWAPRVSAPAFGAIPYLSVHNGGLFLDPRVCFLGRGVLCRWPLFPKGSVPPISLSLVDIVLTKSMISSMFFFLLRFHIFKKQLSI